jgi:D-aminopeptidase
MAERWREISGPVGRLPTGPRNAITDVPGVRVGHSRSEAGERSGVTVVEPPSLPVRAATAVVNGMGELTGRTEMDERGTIETPVYLCGTHAVGIVHHAAVLASGRGPDDPVLPVVAEGSVGAGTGMVLYGYPGGIGTASRSAGEHTVGVLLICNFGDRDYLDVPGFEPEPLTDRRPDTGSCIWVCATDAPMSSQQLRRLALRPGLGLARSGSYGAEGSGEIGLAFSTAEEGSLGNDGLDPYFAAAYEAAHEAVYNCLVAARPAERLDGTMQQGFPVEEVRSP